MGENEFRLFTLRRSPLAGNISPVFHGCIERSEITVAINTGYLFVKIQSLKSIKTGTFRNKKLCGGNPLS